MKNSRLAAAAVGFASLSAPSVVSAAATLDQSHVFVFHVGNTYYGTSGRIVGHIGNEQYLAAQTVTAGLSGLLSKVDLQLSSNNQPESFLILSVYRGGSDSSVGTELLGTLDFQSSYFQTLDNPFATIDLTSLQIGARPGDTFTFAVGAANATSLAFWTNSAGFSPVHPDDYTSGNGFTSTGAAYTQIPDFGFRTYIDTAVTPAPEPGEWAMMLGGLSVIGFVTRRKGARS